MVSFRALALCLSLSAPAFAGILPFVAHDPTLQRRGALCDGAGYDLGTNAYFFLVDPSLATKYACADHCRADPRCKSFAIGKGACMHYDVNVEANSRSDNKSPYSFFDRSCLVTESSAFVAPPATATATATPTQSPSTPATTSAPAQTTSAPAKTTMASPSVITADVPLSSVASGMPVALNGGGSSSTSAQAAHATDSTSTSTSKSDGTTPNSSSSSLEISHPFVLAGTVFFGLVHLFI